VQSPAFEGPVGSADAKRDSATRTPFTHSPCFTDDESATPATRRSFEEARQVTGMPGVSSDLRAIARWPEFLESYWGTVRSLVRSPIFSECQRAIEDTAASLTRELPGPIELTLTQLAEAGIEEEDISASVRAVDHLVHGFSLLCLSISVAKIGLEGGNISRAEDSHETRTPQVA
jgi:hypothetical protein